MRVYPRVCLSVCVWVSALGVCVRVYPCVYLSVRVRVCVYGCLRWGCVCESVCVCVSALGGCGDSKPLNAKLVPRQCVPRQASVRL